MDNRYDEENLLDAFKQFKSKDDLLEALEWFDKTYQRIVELSEGWGMSPPNSEVGWLRFSLHLMSKHEPGINPFPKKAGAKPKPGTLMKDTLIIHALGTAKAAGKSINAAAHHLSKTKQFKGSSPEWIRRRYYDLKKADTPEGIKLREFLRSLQETSEGN